MTLTFHTPSRRCPLRHRNGQRVTILFECYHRRFVRRCRGYVKTFAVEFPDGKRGLALPDELLIEPEEAKP